MVAYVTALGLAILLIGCTDPGHPRTILVVNLDEDVRIIHAVVGNGRELGWYRIEGATQAPLASVPETASGLHLTLFTADCQQISSTGYPTTSDLVHHVVVDRGELVLEDSPSPRPVGELVRVQGCDVGLLDYD
jgi:hypothetical protein